MAKTKRLPYICQFSIPPYIREKSKFDAFCRWRAIRALGTRFELEDREKFGLSDEDDEELIKHKSQKALAEHLKLNVNTFTYWVTRFDEEVRKRTFWYCDRWLGDRTPTVFQSMVKGMIEKPDAAMTKLFLQYAKDFKPTEKVEEKKTQFNLIFKEIDQRETEKTDKIVS